MSVHPVSNDVLLTLIRELQKQIGLVNDKVNMLNTRVEALGKRIDVAQAAARPRPTQSGFTWPVEGGAP